MPKESQKPLSDRQKGQLLRELEEEGRRKWRQRWRDHIAFPDGINPASGELYEKEKTLRYMLLRALINQQAQAHKVREICKLLYQSFDDLLLFQPWEVKEGEIFDIFRQVGGEKGRDLYRVGALGGIKPSSLFGYRMKAFEGFIRWLEETKTSLYSISTNYLCQEHGAQALFSFFAEDKVLGSGWVGNDPKACRMLVDWIVFLALEIWNESVAIKMRDSLMIVDGHVGKIFSRSSLIGVVDYVKDRPYIINASKMRQDIETIVQQHNVALFYVDTGAYYIYEDGLCTDQNPKCGECPIGTKCMKYTQWTAYQKWKEAVKERPPSKAASEK